MKQRQTLLPPLATLLLAAFLSFRVVDARAADEEECPAGDAYVDCMAKAGDHMAIYVQGRKAYDAARTSGDFTRALTVSRDLAKQGDKNGERLLKMVYLQLGWGAHRDHVQAYVWLTEALAAGDDYVAPLRKQLVQKMTADELAEARSKSGE
jgi:hypothetical protein